MRLSPRASAAAALFFLASAAFADQTVTFDQLLSRYVSSRALGAIDVPAQPATASQPVVRLESTAGSSRSQELFVRTPFDLRAATVALAVDYPLYDAGMRAAADAVAKADADDVRATAATLSDADFNALLDAFAELYVSRAELQHSYDVGDRLGAIAGRASPLLAAGQISNTTAAAWEESALAARSRELDAELRRIDAEARLHEVLGDDGRVVYAPRIEFDPLPAQFVDIDAAAQARPEVVAAQRRVARARLYVGQMEARRKPAVMLSGYVGAGAASSTFSGTNSSGAFGIYGIRVQLALPIFDHSSEADVARAELELARATADRDATLREARRVVTREVRRIDAERKRIAVLSESLDIAKQRRDSLIRLTSAGLRSDFDAIAAAGEVADRATRLDQAQVEEWKSVQRLRRLVPLPRRDDAVKADIFEPNGRDQNPPK